MALVGGPERDSTPAAAIVAGLVAVAATALVYAIARYVAPAEWAFPLAAGLSVGVAWIVCDLLFAAYRPRPVRLAVVALGLLWLVWTGWRMARQEVSDALLGQAIAGVVLLIAPWQAFTGGDRDDDATGAV